MTHITIPALPAKTKGWRKTITALADAAGGAAVEGTWLSPGDVVDIPDGTLVVVVDRTFLRYDYGYRSQETYPVYAATVTIHLAGPDGLRELWTRDFKNDKSAFSTTTRKKIVALLVAHPAPAGTPAVVTAARRLNRQPGPCRWCGGQVVATGGHLVGHGDQIQVEHWQHCPSRHIHEIGASCGLCGINLIAEGGYRAPHAFGRVLVREGEGRWEVRHEHYLNCTTRRLESGEEYRARQIAAREAQNASARQAAEAERKKQERQARREREALEAARAEEARVESLTITGQTSKTLYSKNLGGGQRARLDEHTLTLSDGTSATRWAVVVYHEGVVGSFSEEGDGGDEPDETAVYYRKSAARSAYQRLQFTPSSGRSEHRSGGRECDNCGRGGAHHHRTDSSGIAGVVCDSCNRDDWFMLSFA